MRKALIVVSCFVLFVVITIGIAAPIFNDSVAKDTAGELVDLPLPNNTEFIESIYEAGKIAGNGNGMQYFGAILIKSELSLDELKEFYGTFAEHEWECVVENQKTTDVEISDGHTNLTFKTDIESDDYYIVYSWGSNDTIFHEFDLRGH